MDDNEKTKRMDLLALSVELLTAYAKNAPPIANIPAIEAIKTSLHAEAAALFYMDGESVFSVCIAGSKFPIRISETSWKKCVETHALENSVTQFGTWALPGLSKVLPFWISAKLYSSGTEGGYIFLGKEACVWSSTEKSFLVSIGKIIAPIVKLRYERDVEASKRKETENLLATKEHRLRDLFDGSRDMMYTSDFDDVITGINIAGLEMLGYSSKDDFIGKIFSSFVLNKSDRKLFLERIEKVGYVDDYEIVLTKKDGSSIFCLVTAHALKDAAGKLREQQGIVKDITERIENERDLWKTNLELAEANLKLQKTQVLMVQHEKLASIGQLAAGIAHEINNPLGFLMSNQKTLERYFEKLRKPGIVEENQALKKIFDDTEAIFSESKEGFERIKKIVSSLKNFSRVDQSGDFDTYDVNAGIESTLTVCWNEIKYGAGITKNFSKLPTIRAKGSEINQVLLNLIVNAAQCLSGLKRSEKGIIEIATRLEGDKVVVSIRDNGPGIPEDIRNKIFDPFFTTKEPGKGTGLGLSISYDIIVNKHGGSIWVESEINKGTTFFIILPVAGPSKQA